jgi:preprotein translocase subunit SecE
MGEFLSQFKGEFKKIIWPNRESLIKQTTTVIITSLLVAGIGFIMDSVFGIGFDYIGKIL